MQDSGQPKVTNYLYDGFSYNPLQETASPGNKVTHLYRGAGYLTETRDVQGNGNGSTYYRQPNWRGDVALITNQSGGSVHDYLYTAYGQLLDNNNGLQDSSNFTGPHNHYTLTGKELDTESGLVYFGARYYSSTTGNWLTQDPVRGSLTDPLQRNRYLFNRANPVRFMDPLGLEWIDACNNPADMSCWYARHYAEGLTKPKEQQQQQATNTQVVLYQPLTNGDGGGGDNGGGGGGGGGIGGESYWGDYYVEPPRVPPPPLSNAIALCNSIYAPPQLSGWCDNVEQGVVAPLPPNLYSQIMSSGFAQYAYGLMMEPEKPKAGVNVGTYDRLCGPGEPVYAGCVLPPKVTCPQGVPVYTGCVLNPSSSVIDDYRPIATANICPYCSAPRQDYYQPIATANICPYCSAPGQDYYQPISTSTSSENCSIFPGCYIPSDWSHTFGAIAGALEWNSVLLDDLSTAVSALRFAYSLGGCAAGAAGAFVGVPEPTLGAELAGCGAGYMTAAGESLFLNQIEGKLGILSAELVTTAEILRGNSGWDMQTGEIVVSGNTTFVVGLQVAGQINPEPGIDLLLNLASSLNDRTGNFMSGWWEIRWEPGSNPPEVVRKSESGFLPFDNP